MVPKHPTSQSVHDTKPLMSGAGSACAGRPDATLYECAKCYHLRGGDNSGQQRLRGPAFLACQCCRDADGPAFLAGTAPMDDAGLLVESTCSLDAMGMSSRLSPAAVHACLCLLLCSRSLTLVSHGLVQLGQPRISRIWTAGGRARQAGYPELHGHGCRARRRVPAAGAHQRRRAILAGRLPGRPRPAAGRLLLAPRLDRRHLPGGPRCCSHVTTFDAPQRIV